MQNSSDPTASDSLPALPVMKAFLERKIPGHSPSIRRLRQQILEFVANPIAKAVLLRGPVGAGKSRLARLIALLKRVAPLEAAHAQRLLDLAPDDRQNRIDIRYLASWYVELSLTGLVETLAETQLFGSKKGAYTNALERAGVFEAASRGHMPRGEEAAGAAVTNGIVFLDEIGDLSAPLQAKLLPVLSGGVFYRVGSEGDEDAERQFHGITITASWRELDKGRLRPDLLSRIAPFAIDVPGIDDTKEDFDEILIEIERARLRDIAETIERVSSADRQVAREYWRTRIDGLKPLGPADREFLKEVAWGPRGNIRGLTAAVEQILVLRIAPEMAVANLPTLPEGDLESRGGDGLLDRLLARAKTGDGVAAHLRAIEIEERARLREKLQRDPVSLTRLSESLGIGEAKLREQLRHIDRRRSGEND